MSKLHNMRRAAMGAAMTAALCASGAGTALAANAATASASSAESTGTLEEVVVTARRREETLQTVPISITAISADQLEQRGVDSTQGLNREVPNLVIASGNFFGTEQGSFRIRGLPDVGIYYDGISHQNVFGLLGEIVEMDRVEVLRGPQGTLFGKASLGGAIQYVTRKPADEFGARIKLTTGSFNRADVTAAVDLPLSSTFLTKVTLAKLTRDGYLPSTTVNQSFGSQNDTVARVDALWKPTTDFNWEMSFERSNAKTNGSPMTDWSLDSVCSPTPNLICEYNATGLPGLKIDPNWAYGKTQQFKTASGYVGPDLYTNISTLSTQANYAINQQWALKGLASYRTTNSLANDDFDGIPQHLFEGKNYNVDLETTQELQLLFSGDRLTGTTGVYNYKNDQRFRKQNWFQNELRTDPVAKAAVLAFLGRTSLTPPGDKDTLTYTYVTGWAGFTEWTYKFTDKWSATAGVRYNKDDTAVTAYVPKYPLPALCCEVVVSVDPASTTPFGPVISGSFKNTAPRFSTQYQWTPDVMTYITYAEGFNRGGGTGLPSGAIQPYQPETLKNYEVGWRSDLFDRRLRFNGSVFYSQYDNVQVSQDINFFSVTTNAGKGVAKGAEVEGQWLITPQFSMNYGLGYLKTEYTDIPPGGSFILNGRVFPFAPESSSNIGLQYDMPVANGGSVTLRGDYGFQSAQFSGSDDSRSYIPGYGLVSSRITYHSPDRKWDLALFGTNLTNEYYKLSGYAIPINIDSGTVGRPREWGLTLKLNL